MLSLYHRGTGHSCHIIVNALDKLCRYEKQQWYMMNATFNMQMKQKSTYQLGIRYPGMRGTVQYEREMGGWVGQLWWSKQRGWWWLGLHHRASR